MAVAHPSVRLLFWHPNCLGIPVSPKGQKQKSIFDTYPKKETWWWNGELYRGWLQCFLFASVPASCKQQYNFTVQKFLNSCDSHWASRKRFMVNTKILFFLHFWYPITCNTWMIIILQRVQQHTSLLFPKYVIYFIPFPTVYFVSSQEPAVVMNLCLLICWRTHWHLLWS